MYRQPGVKDITIWPVVIRTQNSQETVGASGRTVRDVAASLGVANLGCIAGSHVTGSIVV